VSLTDEAVVESVGAGVDAAVVSAAVESVGMASVDVGVWAAPKPSSKKLQTPERTKWLRILDKNEWMKALLQEMMMG
jgi:hypothetical protein